MIKVDDSNINNYEFYIWTNLLPEEVREIDGVFKASESINHAGALFVVVDRRHNPIEVLGMVIELARDYRGRMDAAKAIWGKIITRVPKRETR